MGVQSLDVMREPVMNDRATPKKTDRKRQRDFVPTYPGQSQEISPKEIFKFAVFHHRKENPVHWKDSDELHRVMHDFPGLFRSILLELLDKPMSRHEIRDFLNRMGIGRRAHRIGTAQLDLEENLRKAIQKKVLEERDGRYHLTPGGREIAEQMQKVIPAFM